MPYMPYMPGTPRKTIRTRDIGDTRRTRRMPLVPHVRDIHTVSAIDPKYAKRSWPKPCSRVSHRPGGKGKAGGQDVPFSHIPGAVSLGSRLIS